MKKTLADFKRDIKALDKIELVKIEEGKFIDDEQGYSELMEVAIKEKIQGIRFLNYKDTTGMYFKKLDELPDKTRGSFCNYPKAENLEYTGESFKITEKDQKGRVYQIRTYKIIK
jgi:hypothetical protein